MGAEEQLSGNCTAYGHDMSSAKRRIPLAEKNQGSDEGAPRIPDRPKLSRTLLKSASPIAFCRAVAHP
jgi:hypothetical protein